MGEDDFGNYLDEREAEQVAADMDEVEAMMREYNDYLARRTGAVTPTVAALEAQYAQKEGE